MSFRTNLTIQRGPSGRAEYAVKGGNNGRDVVDVVRALLMSKDPAIRALVDRANNDLVQKALTGTIHVDQTLQNMTVAYRNEDYIADRLMPIVPVNQRSGIYFKYDKRSQIAFPDDAMGPRASANEITRSRSTDNYSVKDYGLKDFADVALMQNESAPLNDLAEMMPALIDACDFKREVRVANILTTSANYGSNTTALASGVRWDVSGGKPINDFLTTRPKLWTGAGPGKIVAFTTLNVWNALVQNTTMQALFQYVRDGLLQPEQFGRYFGFNELVIANAWQDTANEGQAESDSKIWPDVFGIIRVANAPSIRNASFGYTFQVDGQRSSRQWFDNAIGTKGGYWGTVTSSEDHKIVAPDTGWLFTTVIG